MRDVGDLFGLFAQGAARSAGRRVTVCSQVRPASLALAEIFAQGQIAGDNLARLGIGPGDIVAVQLPAWAEWLVATVGIARCGAVLLPVVATYGATELGFILRESGAKVLITPDHFRKGDFRKIVSECGELPALAHHVVVGSKPSPGTLRWSELQAQASLVAPEPRLPDDLALLVYTSGTTADPKGVRHSSRTLIAEMAAMRWQRRALAHETVLSPWPPGHIAGAISLMRFLAGDTELVLMDMWDADEATRLIEKHRVNSCSLTPYHLHGLLDSADRHGRDFSSLANCLVGAAPVPGGLVARAAERGLRTYRSYGSSEHPTVTSGTPDDPLEKRLTTEGRPMRGSQIAFVDEAGNFLDDGMVGELVTRGPELFLGYLDERLNEDAFLPGGWFRTGDIGRADADGYLLITDRKKDVIIRGGENISSREVEEILFSHPDIVEAAVVAAPDERLGEIVRAYVVARPGAEPTLRSIAAHFAAAGTARAKTPEQLVIVADFPRNATGKVLKHALRQQARAENQTRPTSSGKKDVGRMPPGYTTERLRQN